MIKLPKPLTTAIYTILVFCFAVSIVWCGDSECLTGSSNDQCSSLICGMLGNHSQTSPTSENSGSGDCVCVCHIPAPEGLTAVSPFFTQSETHILVVSFSIPDAPVQGIYNPPKA